MNSQFSRIGGTARTSIAPVFVLFQEPPAAPPRLLPPAAPPPPADPAPAPAPKLLSQRAAEFYELIQRGRKPRTVDEYRKALWTFFRFTREALDWREDQPEDRLPADAPKRFLDWCGQRKASRARQKLPKTFSQASVNGFLGWFWRASGDLDRCENTISRDWRQTAPWFDFLAQASGRAFLGVPKAALPVYEAPTPIVPHKDTVADWLRDELTATTRPATAKRWPSREERRRVVLMQGFYYLTGCRTEEGLTALYEDLEGCWLLLRPGKTKRPRIIYVTAQALGIVAALHPAAQGTLFPEWAAEVGSAPDGRRFALNWTYSQETFDEWVRSSTSRDCYVAGEGRQQAMRQRLSTYLRPRNRDAEIAQLGHGKTDVVYESYLDRLRPLPKLLEGRKLPELDVEWFSWPEPVEASRSRPLRLLKLYDQIRNDLRRAARRAAE